MRRAWRLRPGECFAPFLVTLFFSHTPTIQEPFASASAETPIDVRPLLVADTFDLPALLPQDSHLLIQPEPIEAFLTNLEGTIPDWTVVYGQGHHDPQFDERLFQLNRSRDERRRDKAALGWRVTFVWTGQLSQFDPDRCGFPVAVGPDFIQTRWGMVRFKPADLPNKTAGVDPSLQERLISRIENGETIAIKVAMTGHLIPEESVIYDFSHEEEGQGLIMPVVQVEQVDYILVEP
jgi:hypothetical protein